MRKRLVPLIAIAFVVAVISTAVFYSLFAGRLNGAPAAVPHPDVVVAARDLAPGTVIGATDVKPVPWAGQELPKGAYASPDQVAGKTVFGVIAQGEPVLESRLSGKDGTGLGVPEGMRAVSVHISDSSGVVAMLKPGHKVDVQEFASRSAKGPKDEVRTLLRAVPVLAVSTQPEPSSQGGFSAPVVTLLASAHDAEELAQADSYARLRLTLRNPLEPAPAAAATSSPASTERPRGTPPPPASGPAGKIRVRAMSLTDEGLSMLATRLGPRIQSREPAVSVADDASGWEALTSSALRSPDRARALAETLLTVPPGKPSWFDLPGIREDAHQRVRVLFTSLDGSGTCRVRGEVTAPRNGRMETRSVETELRMAPGRPIVISGLTGADNATNGNFRNVVIIAVPEPKPDI